MYERAGGFVDEIRSEMSEDDELLILSDHGMVVDWYDDEDDRGGTPGNHSWRAFASSTLDSVPETVFEVAEWINRNASEVDEASVELDIDEERLRDLGYI